MKKIAVLLLLMCLSEFLLAQNSALDLRKKNTFLDAQLLSKLYQRFTSNGQVATLDSINAVLTAYNWNNADSLNYIFTAVLKLKELKSHIKNTQINKNDSALEMHNKDLPGLMAISSNASVEPSSGNLQAMAINYLATFMEKRAKEEVMYYAIDHIFKLAEDSTSKPGILFRQLFPKTRDLVYQLKKSGLYYYSDFSLLKQTIELDYKDIPGNINQCIPDIQANYAMKDGVFAAGQAYLAARNGVRATDFINELGESDEIWRTNGGKSISHLLQLFSNAFTSPEGSNQVWLTNDELKVLDPSQFNNNLIQQFFYGLLLQQFMAQDELKELTATLKSNKDCQDFIRRLYHFKDLSQHIINLSDTIQNRPVEFKFDWTIRTMKQGLDLLKEANDNASALFQRKILPSDAFLYANSVLEIANYVEQKKYVEAGSIVINYILVYKQLTPDEMRKINFFVQLASLKDEKSFENFMTSYAAPIGSSSLKRNASFNLSLNGYVGINGGFEWILNSTTDKRNNSPYFGVTAPIGLTTSFKPSKIGSWSASLILIDLGSLVNARFKGDSTNYSNLRFDQFFSPGIGIGYNFKGTPVTVMANGNWLFNLRDIQYKDSKAIITETNKNVFRMNLSVLIDIPFVTLFNKPKTD